VSGAAGAEISVSGGTTGGITFDTHVTGTAGRAVVVTNRTGGTITFKGTVTDSGTGVALTSNTGYFWFFAPGNVEMVIKVLRGCGVNNSYWVFAGGLTNVKTVLKVTDTVTGKVRTYVNPQNTSFQPIQDVDAFAVCR